MRFLTILSVSEIPPPAALLSMTMTQAIATRLMVRTHFNPILPVTTTRPPALSPSVTMTQADGNTANGSQTLLSNTTGDSNTATGALALRNNDTGSNNTANGSAALRSNTTGDSNTANGAAALFSNLTGTTNTAVGAAALNSNSTGNSNTATGSFALSQNTIGNLNTAVGNAALVNNNAGVGNIALGVAAGSNVMNANNVIAIGNPGANVSNSCFIGQIYSNVQPKVGIDPDLVTISSNGRLGRANISSRRYKHDIQPMHTSSEAIYALNPVSFRYHQQYDPTQTVAFGLIAEEVAEVHPDLVGRNREGQPESVRYSRSTRCCSMNFSKNIEEVRSRTARLRNKKR